MTYHVTKLLVEPVTGPTARLLVRDLSSDPAAEVLLVFFRKLRSPAHDVNQSMTYHQGDGCLAHSSPGRLPPGFLYTSGVYTTVPFSTHFLTHRYDSTYFPGTP